MKKSHSPAEGLHALFLTQRPALLAFLRRRNVGNAAEDLLHDLWLRLPSEAPDIQAPLSYLYRMANSLVIDRHRRDVQASRRERAWSDATGPSVPDCSEEPAADRVLEAREAASQVLAALAAEGDRVSRAFRRHRLDGLTQREVAAELGVSVGTVEGDLRRAYRALVTFRERYDGE